MFLMYSFTVLTKSNNILAGYYYLCDTNPNAKGFLALYKGQHYHLQKWRGVKNALETSKFNIKYSSARTVIKRAFSLFKGRWAILRRKSYYPVQSNVGLSWLVVSFII